jgi:O-antigen/teichoic acid export membrane protein
MPLALMPLLTHRLDPGQYGVMATLTTMSLLLWPVINWSVTSYLGVRFFTTHTDEFPTMFSSALSVSLTIAAALLALFWIFREGLADLLSIPARWSVAIPVMASTMLLPQVAQTISALRNRPTTYAMFEISGAVINFIGTVVFVIALNLAWEGRIFAAMLASSSLTIVALVRFYREKMLTHRLRRADMSDTLRFGSGAMANELAMQALRQGDRILIVILIGQAAMGRYAVALQWSSIMLTILTAFGRAWSPFMFSSLSQKVEGWAHRTVKQTYIVWGMLGLMFISFNIATPIGYNILVDARYHDSIGIVFWITLGYLFTGLYLTQVDYILFSKKTHILAIITAVNLAVNTSLAYVFIGIYGAIGASMAFALTMGVVFCLTFAVSRKISPMPWTLGLLH